MGLLSSLGVVKDKGPQDCIVEGDSKTVISWGKGECEGSWRLHHFISEIKALTSLHKVTIQHIPRSINLFADKVAK